MAFTGAATTTTLMTNVKQVQDGAPPVEPARLQVLPLQGRPAEGRPRAAHDAALDRRPRPGRADQDRLPLVRHPPDRRRRATPPTSRTTCSSGSRTRPKSRKARNASDPPLPAGIHDGHAHGRADGRRDARGGQLRGGGPGHQPEPEGRRLEAGIRRRRGRDQLLHEPAGAGQRLLHALRQRPVGHAERGEQRVERHRRRPAPLPARSPATSPTTRSSCSRSRTPPSPARSCAWRTCPPR